MIKASSPERENQEAELYRYYEDGELERKIQEAVEKSQQAVNKIKHVTENKKAYYQHFMQNIESHLKDPLRASDHFIAPYVTPFQNEEATYIQDKYGKALLMVEKWVANR